MKEERYIVCILRQQFSLPSRGHECLEINHEMICSSVSHTLNHDPLLVAVLASRQCLLASGVYSLLSSRHTVDQRFMKILAYHEYDDNYGAHQPRCLKTSSRSPHLDMRFFFLLSFTQIYVTSAVLGSPFWTGLARAMMRNGLVIGKLAVYDASSLCN